MLAEQPPQMPRADAKPVGEPLDVVRIQTTGFDQRQRARHRVGRAAVGAVLKPAGLDAAKGVISVNCGKDPLDPTWKDDSGLKKYFDFMAKYYPDGDKDPKFNSYGYATAQLLL